MSAAGPFDPSFMLNPTPVKASAYTAGPQDLVLCDATGGSFAVSLPAAPPDRVQIAVMLVATSGSNTVTVAAAAGDVFPGGQATWSVGTAGQCLTLQYDASRGMWVTIGGAAGAAPSIYQPWQFRPETHGAQADAVIVSDAVMTNGSANLACTTSTPFTSTAADGGKTVVVQFAGASGFPLETTISTVTDSGHAVLAATASAAVSGAGCVLGTNDTAAIQTAINDATTYATDHDGYAEVIFQPVAYMIAGAAVTGGATLGNAQITLPVITAGSARKVTLALLGLQAAASPGPHWLQTVPWPSGAVLVSTGQGTLDGTYGPGCVIGGPYDGYGGGGGTFSNVCVVVDGLTISPVYYADAAGQQTGGGANGPGRGGLNLWGMGQAVIKSFSYIPLAVPLLSATAWPYFSPPEDWSSTQWQPGLVLPVVGNNDLADCWQYTCYGAWSTAVVSEHFNIQAIRSLYCGRGLQMQGGGGGGTASHGAQVLYMSSEETGIPVSAETAGYYRVTGPIGVRIETLDLESYDSDEIVLDQGGNLSGEIHFNDLAAPGYRSGGLIQAPSGTALKLVQLNLAPGVVASPPALASGTAVPNYYYRDAAVTVAGTVSAVAVDSTTVGAAAGTYFVPSGHAITVTGSGLSWHWVLL